MKENLDVITVFVATTLYNSYWELPTELWLKYVDAGEVLGIIVTDVSFSLWI